jgi:transposase
MELKDLELFPPIPTDTANAALLVIGNGNFYLSIGRQANSLFSNLAINELSIERNMEARKVARFYLISIFQFMEVLSDKQVAEAMKNRVDWKYALHLPLDANGLKGTELCVFRQWLLANSNYKQALQTLLRRICETTQAIHKPRLRMSTPDVIAQICLQNRLDIVWGQFSDALRVIAASNPTWLGTIYQPHWYQRYGKSTQASNFGTLNLERTDIAQAIGNDGAYLLKAVAASNLMDLQNLPEISALRQVWEEQYSLKSDTVLWRTMDCTNCRVPSQWIH